MASQLENSSTEVHENSRTATVPSSPITTPNITNIITVQLNQRNYTVWKSLFSTFLRSHNLLGYADGKFPCPPADDPTYSSWCRTDDSIRSWLYATLSESLLEEVHDLISSKAVWDALQARYVDRSRARSLDI